MHSRGQEPKHEFARTYYRWRRRPHGRRTHTSVDDEYGKTYWSWRARVEQARHRDYTAALRREGRGRLPLRLALRLRYFRRRWLLCVDAAATVALLAALLAAARYLP